MKEAQKCLKEKGIRAEDVKNLPPIEELCKPIPHPSTIEVHSLQHFDEGDIPYGKPPDQCLEELDIFIVKQGHFNKQIQNHLLENSRSIKELKDIVERTSNDIKILCKHFQMVQTQIVSWYCRRVRHGGSSQCMFRDVGEGGRLTGTR